MSDRARHDLDSDAAAGWGESATSSVEPGQQAQIKTFTSVTGADDETALHVLEAHNWDVDRSVMFFLEGGAPAQPQPRPAPAPAAPSAPPAPSGVHAANPIDLDDDAELNAPQQHQPAPTSGVGPPSQQELWEMDEDEQNLQRALQASMQPAAAEASVASDGPEEQDAHEDEDAAFGRMLATHNENVQSGARPLDGSEDSFAGFNRGFLDGGGSRSRPGRARLPIGEAPSWEDRNQAFQAVGHRLPLPPHAASESTAASAGPLNASATFYAPSAASASGQASAHAAGFAPEMPSDINVEEARYIELGPLMSGRIVVVHVWMLEAAMLGLPYEGPIPDFTNQPARPTLPMSPTAVAGRAVRQEQDYAYQQSLQADRDKREAADRIERDKKEAAEAAARQLAEQQAADDAKEADLKSLLERKQQALPAEPGAGEEDVVQVAVRMPNGSRFTRRLRCTDQLSSLFDAIDVHTQGENLPPASYRIVAQYPRRVFTDGTPGSLREVGLAQGKQETVLIEPID